MEKIAFTKTAHYFENENGIIISKVPTKIRIDVPDVKESLVVLKEISDNKGNKILLLSDIRNMLTMTKAARNIAQGKPSDMKFGFSDIVEAIAIVVDSGISKLLGNFFIGFNKTPFPTKIFTKEDQALEWLSAFKENTN